jgi:hypothetical protein
MWKFETLPAIQALLHDCRMAGKKPLWYVSREPFERLVRGAMGRVVEGREGKAAFCTLVVTVAGLRSPHPGWCTTSLLSRLFGYINETTWAHIDWLLN